MAVNTDSIKLNLLDETYDRFVDSALGDYPMDNINEIIDKRIMGYGTAIDEKLMSFEDVVALILRQREQSESFDAYYYKKTPVHRKIFADGKAALYVDEIQLNITIANETNKLHLRLSTVLEYRNGRWIAIHFHGSTAEHVAGDEDPWHVGEWRQRQAQLERQVEEKTLELITKNHELEIEAALERVRAVAMGMNKHDDLLQICESSFVELKKLGFENVRNVVIHIPYDEENYFMDYDFSDFTGGQIGKVDYGLHPIVDEYLEKIRSAEDAFFEVVIDEEMLDSWNDFRRESGQMLDQRLDNAEALYYYLFSIGIGDIGISTFKPINDSQIKTLKKFRNVFSLTYKRYTDIALAAAQAREAQVEAALERIRSQALGMRNSEEIGNVSDSFFTEFNNLTVKLLGCTIAIVDEAKDSMELWRARSGVVVKPFDSISFSNSMQILKKNLPDWYPVFISALKKRNNFLMDEVSGEKRVQAINSMAEQSNYSNEEKARLFKAIPENFVTYYIYFKLGYLALITEKKLPDENLAIARRFVNVFGFAYTRFLDIKKAETRAREAQIEAALEKVRSAALAMQQPQDMVEVCRIISGQLEQLQVTDMRNIQTAILNQQNGTYLNYEYYTQYKTTSILEIETKLHPTIEDFAKQITKSKDAFFTKAFEGKELLDWIEYRKQTNQNDDPLLEKSKSVHYYFYSIGQGGLGISTYAPMNKEEIGVFKRFRNVFDLAYKRFIDIEQVEAQAREAQIQLALERIRARTMAMQHSSELAETAKVLFQQFNALGENPDQLSIGIINNEEKVLEVWLSIQGTQTNQAFKVAIDEPIVINKIYRAWKNKKKSLVIDISGQELEKYNQFRNSLPEFQAYNQQKNIRSKEKDRRVIHCAFFQNGMLSLATPEPRPDESMRLLERFAGVFEQTYTRFLDLQKAEAQAREAQIEAALERVRSRSMAMHSSNELVEASDVMFAQLEKLEINALRIGICTIDRETGTAEIWSRSEHKEKTQNSILGVVPLGTHPVFDGMVKAWKENKPYFCSNRKGDEVRQYYKALSPHLSYPLPKKYNKQEHISCFFFTEGSLNIISLEPLTEKERQILIRFANAFGQMYTRFLDLKKAEAQAREAQIEASLERARAQSMMMQRSDELDKTCRVFHEQLAVLGIESEFSYLWLPDELKNEHLFWATWQEGNDGPESFKNKRVIYPLDKSDPAIAECYLAWESDQPVHVNPVPPADVKDYFSTWDELFEGVERFNPEFYPDGLYYVDAYMKYGCFGIMIRTLLSEEERRVLNRFSMEFERAYTRFLDLQKAEAQTREAQIELALESIRAQVTAMHESSELLDIVVMMQSEFTKLGHEAHYFWHMRWLPDKYEKALTNGEGTRIGNVLELPRGFHGLKTMLDWEETEEPSAVFALNPETGADYIDKMINLGRFQEIDHSAPGPDDIRKMGGITFVMARTTHGEIGYSLPGEVPNPPDEDVAILVRFAGVFDLAYRRFEDLQSAERRNRETRIELALERVRARTMAMHKSDELAETASILFKQFEELVGLPDKSRTFISIIDKNSETAKVWMTLPDGKVRPGNHQVPLTKNYILKRVFKAWEKKEPLIIRDLEGKELADYLHFLSTLPHVQSDKGLKKTIKNMPERLVLSEASFANGTIGVMTQTPLEESILAILVRFTHVFEQTYRRFLDLENAEKQNVIIQAENERKTRELEEARTMQLSMLPKEVPQLENLAIAVHMQTATEVGGDYYDFSMPEDGSLNICLGDATGHGLKAGILVSAMKSIFTTNSSKMDIESFFTTANNGIKSMGLKRMMMGFVMLNINRSAFQLLNAGMPPSFLYRKATNSIEELNEHGLPLGAMRLSNYKPISGTLQSGDVLLLLTDGMPELQNKSGQLFGYKRICSAFKKVAQNSPEEIITHLLNEGSAWLNGQTPDDDVSFVVIGSK